MRKLIGEPLGLSVTDAAAAILRVVNDKMAATIRLVSLQRGFDPRDFTLLGFGGAGPLHAVELARELNIPKVLIPHSPGILAAIGCLVARVRQDFVQTVSRRLDSVEDGELAGLLRRHRDNGRAALVRQGVSETTIVTTHIAEMQYEGQTHSVYLPLDTDEPSAASLASTLAGAYRERYGVDLDGYSPRLVNIRTVVEGDRGALDLRRLVSDGRRAQGSLSDARLGERPVYFDGAWHDTPVYHRHRIPGQATLTGPAILAQADSTVVIPPRCRATTDALGNLLIDVEVAK
jgi:N-methylhydantoinase A